ncbi:MAG: acetate/propionate family kinase [Gammaproteobacteria bacterium]|nr:acetate/propionate family kinase [Gammaproteobacteria bacterium]MBU1647263.1 acetate/propionate family kinase [Gammaproteobacteria bacterium]MBU1972775.1 acetate/propionate family kinase [Gammaproteobacteria bacterium]
MSQAILTINAGSSSIKFALFALDGDAARIPARPELLGQIDGIGASPHLKAKDAAGKTLDDVDLDLAGHPESQHRAALTFLVEWLQRHEDGRTIAGVGHRVVHGAEKYSQPIRLDSAAIAQLQAFIPLAPLHQPHNLAGIEAMRAALPGIPQVACFDTAFHRSQPAVAQLFALPRRITAQGVRRYGFHGLSYEYIADVLPQHLDAGRADGRVIVAHLGNGASMCGMLGRRSMVTTMGFTAVEGLMMGTRSGSLDPGVLLYLMDYAGMDAKALTNLLYKESGLLGVSGISQDMRELLASPAPEAAEAVELFCYRIVREIGSLAAALGGLDALVFTGGIGEHAAPVRQMVCSRLGWLGIELDPVANAADAVLISTAASRGAALVLPTNEEWMLARHTARLLA